MTTEMQRILLLVGMAVTGYLMILAWTDDYHGADTTVAPYAAAPVPQGQDNGAAAADAPTPAAPGSDAPAIDVSPPTSDAPDDSLLGVEAPAVTPSEAAPVLSDDRLVEVTTPKLKVWIDRQGGDIVRVQLPEYPVDIERPDLPFLLLDNSGGHTYIAQSGSIGPDGLDKGQRPLFTSARDRYELTESEGSLTVELTADVDGALVTKSFGFESDAFLVAKNYRIQNNRPEPMQAAYFAQIKRDNKAPPAGGSSFSLGPQPYLGGALTTAESRYEKVEFDDLVEEGPLRQTVDGGWIAFLQHYFLSAWVADPAQSNRFYAHRQAPERGGLFIFGYTAPLMQIAPGASADWQAGFFAGPKDQSRLESIAPNLNLTVDYGFLWWLAVPLFKVLDWIHGMVGNWGIAIILLTVIVKAILYPLSAAAYKSMANMRRVAPQLKRIQERYADDRQKLSQEMMSLYKKEGVNPFGGCLPMLLPMPIFLALYWVLYESVELRHAPFMLWIDDLSAMDPFFVLPLLMGASMYLQQLLSPQMGDPMQVRMMKMMPVLFTFLFLFFPAGLVLYWLVNNVLSIAQQWYVIKQTEGAA